MLSFAEFLMYGLSVVNEFVLAWSTYSSLQKASDPKDYDVILSRVIKELQFHCETVRMILFLYMLCADCLCAIAACHVILYGNNTYT